MLQKKLLGEMFDKRCLFARAVRKGCQMFDRRGIEFFFQERQQFLAHASPRPRGVAVGRVFAPSLLLDAQVSSQFFPPESEQWPCNLSSDRMNSGEARNSRPAQDMRQNRFRLVVHRMSSCHNVHKTLPGQTFEKCIPRTPRRIFKIGFFAFRFSSHIHAPNVQSHSKFFREPRDKFFIPIRCFPAQPVIKVNRANHNSQVGAQLRKQRHERN